VNPRHLNNSVGFKTLLVLNYEMDENSQIFSHQIEVVRRLADEFERVLVITNKVGVGALPINVQLYESGWLQGEKFRNSIKFLLLFIQILRKNSKMIIFSHMTEIQSALISPLTKILGIRHLIWYAHKSKSLAMNVNFLFVDKILTSTTGSCPYTGRKVQAIGQAIDSEKFINNFHTISSPTRLLHIGRFDPSKNIQLIIDACRKVRSKGFDLNLTIVGAPSSALHDEYARAVREKVQLDDDAWIAFKQPIKRAEIPDFFQNYDVFIHAFEGSLDKSIVEATFSGIPVVTLNQEYQRVFGAWTNQKFVTLEDELIQLLRLEKEEVFTEVTRRHEIANSNHALQSWVRNLVNYLT
jgi:glycosyltransferase involved in cell wall biosynthesis